MKSDAPTIPKKRRHRYANGYPYQLLRESRKGVFLNSLGSCIGIILPLGAVLWAGVGYFRDYAQRFPHGLSWLEIAWMTFALLAIPLVCFLAGLFVFNVFRNWCNLFVFGKTEGSILPYFRATLEVPGQTDSLDLARQSFNDGEILARNCEAIDNVAISQGVSCLSDFGFIDDRAPSGYAASGKNPVWYASAEVLHAAQEWRKGIANAEESGLPEPERGKLLGALDRLLAKLEAANAKGIRLCFILRHGIDQRVYPWSFEERQGYFG